MSYLNLHFALQNQRWRAASGGVGPRVLIAGAPASGKSTLARTLLALATRQHGGQQPVGVGLDPRDGMLSLPGTVSAAVFGSVMDVETGGAGVADTPSSGPAAVPVKVPVVYYYGRQRVEDEPAAWRTAVSALAGAVRGRREVDGEVRRAGVVVDAPAVGVGKDGVGLLVHVVEEFAGKSSCGVLMVMITDGWGCSQRRCGFGVWPSECRAPEEFGADEDESGRAHHGRAAR